MLHPCTEDEQPLVDLARFWWHDTASHDKVNIFKYLKTRYSNNQCFCLKDMPRIL